MTAQPEGDPPGPAEPGAERPTTVHGTDPDTTAAAAICAVTPASRQARTRLYRHGVLERRGFPVEDIGEYIGDESAEVWLDLRDPDRAQGLAVASSRSPARFSAVQMPLMRCGGSQGGKVTAIRSPGPRTRRIRRLTLVAA